MVESPAPSERDSDARDRPRGWALVTRLQRLVAEMMDSGIRLDQAVREFERQFILAALEKNRGNRSLAARSLGIHRNTLHGKIHHHKLKV